MISRYLANPILSLEGLKLRYFVMVSFGMVEIGILERMTIKAIVSFGTRCAKRHKKNAKVYFRIFCTNGVWASALFFYFCSGCGNIISPNSSLKSPSNISSSSIEPTAFKSTSHCFIKSAYFEVIFKSFINVYKEI